MKFRFACIIALAALVGCAKTSSPFAPKSVEPPVERPTQVAAPTPPPAVKTTTISRRSPEFFRKSVGDRIQFDVDQYTLNDRAKAILNGQIAWLKDNPSYTVVIEGHADEQGTREYNIALGARRASAVRDYLVSKGISSSRVRTLSFGKERPIEVCSEENCYAQNRRAVTVLAGGNS